MELEEAKVKVNEITSHKNDFDYAFGTKIQRPFAVSHEGLEAIETVLQALDNSIPKEKINKIINRYENGNGSYYMPSECYKNFTREIVRLVGYNFKEE